MTSTTIPHQARNLRRSAALIEGADHDLYNLPDEIFAHRDGIVRLATELDQPAPAGATDTEARYVDQLVEAARTSTDLPDVTPVIDAEALLARHGRRAALLIRAIEQADAAFESLIIALSDTVIRDHLAPAVAEVMQGVTAAAGALPDDTSPETILRASDKARKAWLSLDDVAARYEAIRRGAAAIRLRTAAEWDNRGDFSELYNFHELTKGLNIQMGGPRPWPTPTAARLLWYARNGGEVWLPTVAEQDARYREVHKDAIAQQEHNRHRVSAARHAFG